MTELHLNGSQDAPPPQEHVAPVVSSREIQIAAAPEDVWEVLTQFDHWPSWNPDVKSMSIKGSPVVGSTFLRKAGPGTIRSTIQQMQAPQHISWTGRTLGIKALDSWELQAREGGTVVREEESWDGLVARLFRRSLQRTLDRSLESGLRHLKAEVERKQQPQ